MFDEKEVFVNCERGRSFVSARDYNVNDSYKKIGTVYYFDSYEDLINYEKFNDFIELNLENICLEEIGILPKRLEILNCSDNYIDKLDNLPETLQELYCDGNAIEKLDNLPPKLESLICDNNKIETLDNLPDSLNYLDCNNNSIKKINKLPENLTNLDCGLNDELDYLCNLPLGLNSLKIYDCELLKTLPSNLILLNNLTHCILYNLELELTLPQIRFLNRIRNHNNISNTNNIYQDGQNVHNSHIQKGLIEGINMLFL